MFLIFGVTGLYQLYQRSTDVPKPNYLDPPHGAVPASCDVLLIETRQSRNHRLQCSLSFSVCLSGRDTDDPVFLHLSGQMSTFEPKDTDSDEIGWIFCLLHQWTVRERLGKK